MVKTILLKIKTLIKVRLEVANFYYYPDVAVTCDERDLSSNEDFILYPCLIIEILSPSTASFDRGGKFANYQTATSLQEYQDLRKDTIYSVFSVFA